MSDLRQALDDAVLNHTGRSLGDLASQQVLDDITPLLQANEELAALRQLAEKVAKLEEDWIGNEYGGGHGYYDSDVRPLVEQAQSILKRWQHERA